MKTKGFSHWAFTAVNNSNRNKHLTKKETEAISLTQVTWQPCWVSAPSTPLLREVQGSKPGHIEESPKKLLRNLHKLV